ncbi:MAG: N-acetyl-gamma-glutamyl-phosphate reductase [Anaerolineales bacterium]
MGRIRTGIYGATGYTGLELARLLSAHPEVELVFATSESLAGKNLQSTWPQAPDIELVAAQQAPLETVQQVFLCLPHTQAAPAAAQALAQNIKVVDLSADLRLNDPGVYQQWYHAPHPAPHLLPVPYGLPELGRERLLQARCIANPGCYATAVQLGLAPLLAAGLVNADQPIVVDAKSGVTGAGRTPKQQILFGEVTGNLSPYNIGRSHRHLAEIEQELKRFGYQGEQLVFVPHLLPVDRGILAAHYIPISQPERVRAELAAWYAPEALVKVLPEGELATLRHVVHTPLAVISVTTVMPGLAIVMVALDNLLKGAASQAVQNFNLMWDLPETTGLLAKPPIVS